MLNPFNSLMINPEGTLVNFDGVEISESQFIGALRRLNNGASELFNSVGFEQALTSLTQIKAMVVQQRFYEIAPADYMPVVVGEGAFSTNLLAYREFVTSGGFSAGVINTGTAESRTPQIGIAVDALNIPIVNWKMGLDYNLFEVQQLAQNKAAINLIESKERGRKKVWDLGIQEVAFLGLPSMEGIEGFLTLSNVNVDLTTITGKISLLNPTDFAGFVATLIEAYRNNCNRTAMPNLFVIPEDDFNGLVSPVSPDFPVINKLTYLLEAFRNATQNPNFEIKPLSYAMASVNASHPVLGGTNRNTLTRKDPESLQFNLPLDYTTTVPMAANGFDFSNCAYGQFTGVVAPRERETLYLDY